MRIEPTIKEVVYGKRGMLRGIEIALADECLVSGVALMFTAIDSVSALNRPITAPSTDSGVFQKWTDQYLEPMKTLGCTSKDHLFAARCGILHTYSE